MLGSMPMGEDGDRLLQKLIEYYADEARVTLRTDVTKGTIVAPRQGDGYTLWVIVNMDGSGGSVTIPQEGLDVLSRSKVDPGPLHVGPYEHLIIRFTEN
ncbi:Beta-galactosidase YesZ [Paenibacillus allorhizosphaerae]|uniref:Beta-galactosidase YesZ n=1 Tax=Paenibacillus allorhizosphaerae TaxID=2849866 RepID=A0ABM8VGC7_9BACL|nr:Beta-galactosidase YesZ [Paenibacillus allorhizosphaerae]